MKKKRALAASRIPDDYSIESHHRGIYTIRDPGLEPNSVIFHTGTDHEQVEMLKITKDAFYVRGVKVEQDAKEAKLVYDAFHEWMVWAAISRKY